MPGHAVGAQATCGTSLAPQRRHHAGGAWALQPTPSSSCRPPALWRTSRAGLQPAAIAADQELGSSSSSTRRAGRSARRDVGTSGADPPVLPDPLALRAQRLNERLNEAVWQQRLGGGQPPECTPSVSPRVEAQEALSHCRWAPGPTTLSKSALWARIRQEARGWAEEEPVLASYLHMTVIMHSSMERSLAFILANKLQSSTILGTQLSRLFNEAYEDDPDILEAAVADLQAVMDRDPACDAFVKALLYFKGFQALQAHRVAHWMWQRGRRSLALALQSRMSETFSVDIHPAARMGRGVLIDHATAVVIGETAVVGDNVSMLHHVTLGGSGTGKGARHPVVGNGVLLGAGVSVLGPIVVGHCTKVGAGSVVAQDLPPHVVAVGVPARVVKKLADMEEPVKEMDQVSGFILDYVI